jgi:transcriptional regulator with XRE-family HTH domain
MTGTSFKHIEKLIRLVKIGDTASLIKLRQELGKTQKEVASKVGISEGQFGRWERGEQKPSRRHHIHWKLKLSYYIDDVIAETLGTKDSELNTQLWELMWRLLD